MKGVNVSAVTKIVTSNRTATTQVKLRSALSPKEVAAAAGTSIDHVTEDAVTYAYTGGYLGSFANRGVVVWSTGYRAEWPDEYWKAGWESRDYWPKRWRRDELHQWFRHLPFGQARWYDHMAGVYREMRRW